MITILNQNEVHLATVSIPNFKKWIILLGSFELARSGGNQPLCKSRASPGSSREAEVEVGSSYWLCQPFPIYVEDSSACKFHEEAYYEIFSVWSAYSFFAPFQFVSLFSGGYDMPFTFANASSTGFVDSRKTVESHFEPKHVMDWLWAPFSFQDEVIKCIFDSL